MSIPCFSDCILHYEKLGFPQRFQDAGSSAALRFLAVSGEYLAKFISRKLGHQYSKNEVGRLFEASEIDP